MENIFSLLTQNLALNDKKKETNFGFFFKEFQGTKQGASNNDPYLIDYIK